MPFIETTRDLVRSSDTQVQIAARWLNDLIHEPPKNQPARATELVAVENLVQHDRASGDLNLAHASALPVLLVGDDDAVLVDTLPRFDTTFESILPNVGKHVPVFLEMSVDSLEVAETRMSHGYFFLKTKIGSVLKALFPICFSPTILLI